MKLLCETCKKEFEHRKRMPYCSRECDPKRHKECTSCGESFYDDTRVNKIQYCGDACKPSTPKSRNKTCEYCQTKFKDESKQNSMKFCGENCRRKAKITRNAVKLGSDIPEFLDELKRECVYCEASYTPREVSQMYCTVSCRDEAYRGVRYEDVPLHLLRTVTCLECDTAFHGCIPHGGRSGNHFETQHGMTTQEYQAKHNVPIYCEASIWKQKQKTWEASDEARANYSKGQLRYYAQNDVWNKGLTAQDHSGIKQSSDKMKLRFLRPEDNPFYGKEHSKESIDLIKQKHKALQSDIVYLNNWMRGRETASKLGMHLSEPHAVLIQAMRNAGMWDRFKFDMEVWVTLEGIRHGIDIASKEKFKIAIEVDGCLFHRCPEHCNYEKLNPTFQDKIDERFALDREIDVALLKHGWITLRFWEHDLKDNLTKCVETIAKSLGINVKYQETYREVKGKLDVELRTLMVRQSSYRILKEDSVEQIFDYYRIKGFPYLTYSSTQIKKDFDDLVKYDTTGMETDIPNEFEQRRKGLGMKAPNYFMRNFFEARRSGRDSMLEVFNDDERLVKVIESRKKHARNGLVSDATMRTGLRIHAGAPSSFPAAVAKHVYQRYLPITTRNTPYRVLDPCAGFGGRMVGSQSLPFPIEYVGVDPWTENVENLETMRTWFEFYTCTIIHKPFEEVKLEAETFDFAFTSPPHYDKEIYTLEGTQSVAKYPKYEDWVQGFLEPMIQQVYAALRPDSYFVLHVSDMEVTFVQDSKTGMEKAGFNLEPDLLWKQQNFLKGNKAPRYETFIVGRK